MPPITDEFKHTVDNDAIVHTLKKHGSEQEYLRGQIPVVDADFLKIPYIISNYDTLKVEKNNRKQDIIIYSKEYADGSVYFVEEVRNNRKELAMASLYKRKKR